MLVDGAKQLSTRWLAHTIQSLVSFVLGFFLVISVYLLMSQQVTVTAPQLSTNGRNFLAPQSSTTATDEVMVHINGNLLTSQSNETERIPQGDAETLSPPVVTPICDLSDPRYVVCEMLGDARVIGGGGPIVFFIPSGHQLNAASGGMEWRITDQSRKYLPWISNVTVKSLAASQVAGAPSCSAPPSDVPAVVFSVGGLTGNPWHDFSDVLIPLFITARAFAGDVQFMVTDYRQWFVDKYARILKNLSWHEIVNLDDDAGGGSGRRVWCHRHVIVGLRSHRDLGIDSARSPENYTMLGFRQFIREAYSLPQGLPIPYKAAPEPKPRPRMMIVNRASTRKLVNIGEVVAAAKAAGFEVVQAEPARDAPVERTAQAVDACDVLMGVHGAGLTNFVFLRDGAVMLQIVPYGHMEYAAAGYYGIPAREAGLLEVSYSISAAESTLKDKYGAGHPAISDPEAIHRKGWQEGMRLYWYEQNVRLNVTRFAPTLVAVVQLLNTP